MDVAEDAAKRSSRMKRFAGWQNDDAPAAIKPAPSASLSQSPIDVPTQVPATKRVIPRIESNKKFKTAPIVGTATKLEKDYFRLTSAVDPSTVRPLPVLKQTLEFLKKRWLENCGYDYIREQFKSLRQDITVQHLAGEFVVSVYETHARIAMEAGDLDEFGQCQSKLKELFDRGMPGHAMEFSAYHILYSCVRKKKTADMGLLTFLSELSKEMRADPCIKHACEVRRAVLSNDYSLFFQLYRNAPNMSAYLMDFYLDRMRTIALEIICTAYRPSVSPSFLQELMVFSSPQQCMKFLREVGAVFLQPSSCAQPSLPYTSPSTPCPSPLPTDTELAIDARLSLEAIKSSQQAAAEAAEAYAQDRESKTPAVAAPKPRSILSLWAEDEPPSPSERKKKKKLKAKMREKVRELNAALADDDLSEKKRKKLQKQLAKALKKRRASKQ